MDDPKWKTKMKIFGAVFFVAVLLFFTWLYIATYADHMWPVRPTVTDR